MHSIIAFLSWIFLAGFPLLIVIGLRDRELWTTSQYSDRRLRYTGFFLFYMGATFFFAWLAPSANPIFPSLARDARVLGSLFAGLGTLFFTLGVRASNAE